MKERKYKLEQSLRDLESEYPPVLSHVQSPAPSAPNSVSGLDLIVKQLKRPVFEMDKFSGDPLKYISFMRQFRTNVLPYCDKMMLLTQYTTGEANQIVSSVAHPRDNSAFKAAMESLDSRYGDSEVIAATYVSRAF